MKPTNTRKEPAKTLFAHDPYPQEMFEAMIQNSPAAMYISEDFSFTYVNKQLCELNGYSKEELLSGKVAFSDLIHPDDLHIVKASVHERIYGNAKEARYRVRSHRKNGALQYVEVHASKMVHNGRTLTYGTIIDVTEQVTAQIQLQENQERFESLFYNNPDAIFKFDMEGNFIDVNPGCTEVIKYSAEELLEMSLHQSLFRKTCPSRSTISSWRLKVLRPAMNWPSCALMDCAEIWKSLPSR